MPLVSVVIPTRNRPQLLLRAVNSVLTQSEPDLELIVVVDGPDPETRAALLTIADPRLTVLQNDSSEGPGESRNRGVAASSASWVAFLDDDDEWFSEKLARQLAEAGKHPYPTIVAALCRVVTPLAEYVWPTRVFDNRVPYDEYVFDRRSMSKGGAFVATPSLLVPRKLLETYRFPKLRHYEDWEFLISATRLGGARIVTIPEPLLTVYTEENRESLSASNSWRASLEWIDKVRPLISARSYRGFCLTVVAPQAAATRDYRAAAVVIGRVFQSGIPRAHQFAFFVAIWLIPIKFRRFLRRLLSARGQFRRVAGEQGKKP